MKSNSKDQEINTEVEQDKENLADANSDHDSSIKQVDAVVSQNVELVSGTPMELSDFFNESSESNGRKQSFDSQKISDENDKNLDHSLNSECEDECSKEVEPSSQVPQELDNDKGTQPPTKVPRVRDLDEDIEPSAKRLKTEDISKSFEASSAKFNGEKPSRENGAVTPVEEKTLQNATITSYQAKEITKIIRNISRTNAGKNFRQPVAVLWPSIAENYASKISNPMDLSTIEKKLKEEVYHTMNDLKADVHLIYNNSVIFNTAENPVSKFAMETRNTLFSKFSSIPPEPIPPPKKEKKIVKRNPQISDLAIRPPPKRNSRETQALAQNNTQAFPLSNKLDAGRPKREIHPPKNKDLPYAVRPKNKKHSLELKFCEEALSELQKSRYNSISHPFMDPVDPVALGIPNYFAIIKKPMDISTVSKKLKDGVYLNANEFEKDVRQIFINCYKYNPEGNPVRQMGKSFEEIFNNIWAKKEQYLVDNSPSAACPSDRDSEDESDEDDALDGPSVAASLMSQKERLLEEQSKLITLMGAKHKDEGLLQMQTDLVELIQKRVKAAEEQAKKTLNSKKKSTKSIKKSVPIKKAAPVKKTAIKKKYLGTLEKETISAGLGLIPTQVMATVVEMIKTERPELADAGDETMELDIDSISEGILWQIHAMILKHVPHLEGQIRDSMSSEPRQPARSAKPAPKRKNKPMSKHEQERKIEALTNLDSEFARATFGSQGHAMQGLSTYNSSPQPEMNTALEPESSGDEDSDSEEE
ncbi:Bromodomain-containing factor 1 [Erysiphe neolycopersici]|uniref:Bromodomain-containing factor 1 n=1 Tax=Erysiphe neolycopersici TaxID=212602 RepID=A0A420HIL1_9PEZI|nr:Bromodomain-containing factor 1 [Erysiphe neolycopersici]